MSTQFPNGAMNKQLRRRFPEILGDRKAQGVRTDAGDLGTFQKPLFRFVQGRQGLLFFRPAGRKGQKKAMRVAVHEAGHAVMSYHFGSDPGDLSIEPDINSLGRMEPRKRKEYSAESPDQIWAKLEECALIVLGGVAAEHIYDGQPKKISSTGAMPDIEKLRSLFLDLKIRLTYQDIIDLFFNRAIEILEKKWSAVQALAERLSADRFISGKEATRIIKDNLQLKPRSQKKRRR